MDAEHTWSIVAAIAARLKCQHRGPSIAFFGVSATSTYLSVQRWTVFVLTFGLSVGSACMKAWRTSQAATDAFSDVSVTCEVLPLPLGD